MALSASDIAKDLGDSILQSNSTLDVSQGPIPDTMINPQSGQLAISSSDAESLRQLFTLQFSSAATPQEIAAALGNYGSAAGAGSYASHIQHFLRFTKPLVDITVTAGSLISNLSGDLVYRVVNGGTIVASSANLFYNSTRKAYEIGLLVEAIGIGTKYNVPANRVLSLVTPITGIDSTENRAASTGGLEVESVDSQAERLKNSLLGINKGGPGGLKNDIQNKMPESVTDVAVIQPFEKEFYRNTLGPALDIYVIGSSIEIYTQTFVAVGGETIIPLAKKPVTSVLSVTVNGSSVSYSLVPDTSLETGYSLASNDVIVLNTALVSNDSLIVEYTYNSLLESVNTYIFSSGDAFLFNTDILIRYPFTVAPIIAGEIQALPSYSVTEVEQNALTYFTNLFSFTTFTEILYPEVVRQNALTQISGIQTFRITEFRRAYGSLSLVEPLMYGRNEISFFDVNYYNITVAS